MNRPRVGLLVALCITLAVSACGRRRGGGGGGGDDDDCGGVVCGDGGEGEGEGEGCGCFLIDSTNDRWSGPVEDSVYTGDVAITLTCDGESYRTRLYAVLRDQDDQIAATFDGFPEDPTAGLDCFGNLYGSFWNGSEMLDLSASFDLETGIYGTWTVDSLGTTGAFRLPMAD